MRLHYWSLGLVVLALPHSVAAQDMTFGGQIRPRAEFRDPAGSGNDGFSSMRVRASVTALLPRHVRAFIQVQDVRLLGEENNTLSDFRADNFDLHQGYLEAWNADEGTVGARIGRQAVNFGGQRLVGAVEWTQQGRSFDGVRAMVRPSWGSLDLIGFKLGEATSPSVDLDAELIGAYASVADVAGGTLDVYGLYNHVTSDPTGDPSTKQLSVGARLVGSASGVTYRLEGTYQLGERAGVDVAAFLIGARVAVAVADGARVTLWYDYLSGDDDPTDGKIRVFDTLFATNHKYYGFADLFLNIPAHTAGLGLQDIALKGSVAVRDDLTLRLDVHEFLLAREEPTSASRRLGEEIDVTAVYRYTRNLTVTGGVSQVLQQDAFAAIGRLSENMTWAYVMIDVGF